MIFVTFSNKFFCVYDSIIEVVILLIAGNHVGYLFRILPRALPRLFCWCGEKYPTIPHSVFCTEYGWTALQCISHWFRATWKQIIIQCITEKVILSWQIESQSSSNDFMLKYGSVVNFSFFFFGYWLKLSRNDQKKYSHFGQKRLNFAYFVHASL